MVDRRESQRAHIVSGLAGFRGAVSLAAVLATPQVNVSGAPFPDRNLIIFVATGVIVVTLVLQAPLLPVVARWAKLPPDQEVRAEELRTAETSALTDALSALPGVAARLGTDPQVIEELQAEYRQRLSILNALHSEDAPADHTAGLERAQQYRELGLALVAKKRNTVIRLRDERRIDDSVLLRLQARLDIEELRLAAPHDAAEEEDED